jgi:hypothetical protein
MWRRSAAAVREHECQRACVRASHCALAGGDKHIRVWEFELEQVSSTADGDDDGNAGDDDDNDDKANTKRRKKRTAARTSSARESASTTSLSASVRQQLDVGEGA